MPEITIGLPFADDAATLRYAVQSTFAQTRSDWQLVLVNDGSTDGSDAIANAIDDPRVRVISDGANRGLAARLNEISGMARGEYVVRMDADDIMHPERLERQIAFLEAEPEVDVVATGVIVIDADNRPYGRRRSGPVTDDPCLFFRNAVLIHPTVAARREWMVRNPYDVDFRRAQDKELFCRTHQSTRMATMDEVLLFYRELGRFRIEAYRATCRADRRIFRRYGPSMLGRWRTEIGIARSHTKETLYRGLVARGKHERLVTRRSQPLNETETQQARSVLDYVARTQVPGLDHGANEEREAGVWSPDASAAPPSSAT